jgi:hypothetical protein
VQYARLPLRKAATPRSLKAVAVSGSQIDLSWEDDEGNAQSYDLQRCKGAGCGDYVPTFSYIPGNSRRYYDKGLTRGTTYSYRLLATRFGPDSDPSNIAVATTSLAAEPAECSRIRSEIASLQEQIKTWQDELDDLDPTEPAAKGLRVKIKGLEERVKAKRGEAGRLGCTL